MALAAEGSIGLYKPLEGFGEFWKALRGFIGHSRASEDSGKLWIFMGVSEALWSALAVSGGL